MREAVQRKVASRGVKVSPGSEGGVGGPFGGGVVAVGWVRRPTKPTVGAHITDPRRRTKRSQ